MKKNLFILLFTLVLSCNNDDGPRNCNFLLNVGVNASINLNLPEYNQLQFVSNSVYVANQGNGGIIVTNVGSGNFRAWDAADPNHIPQSCSVMEIIGAEANCQCPDENTYSLFTGQKLGEPLPCGLKEYRVSASGNNSLVISN